MYIYILYIHKNQNFVHNGFHIKQHVRNVESPSMGNPRESKKQHASYTVINGIVYIDSEGQLIPTSTTNATREHQNRFLQLSIRTDHECI